MASARQFIHHLTSIEGVRHCILLRSDGQLLDHNLPDPQGLASLMMLAALSAEGVKGKIGLSFFQHMVIGRENRENLLIFAFGRYYLGVVQDPQVSSAQLAETVGLFLARVTTRNAVA